jgi:hypothetical protein
MTRQPFPAILLERSHNEDTGHGTDEGGNRTNREVDVAGDDDHNHADC